MFQYYVYIVSRNNKPYHSYEWQTVYFGKTTNNNIRQYILGSLRNILVQTWEIVDSNS